MRIILLLEYCCCIYLQKIYYIEENVMYPFIRCLFFVIVIGKNWHDHITSAQVHLGTTVSVGTVQNWNVQ